MDMVDWVKAYRAKNPRVPLYEALKAYEKFLREMASEKGE